MKVKVKSESEVAQSCLTLSDPMDHSVTGLFFFFFNSVYCIVSGNLQSDNLYLLPLGILLVLFL